MTSVPIPSEAVDAGLAAWADRKAVWPRDVVRHILEAAAPHLTLAAKAEAWDEAIEEAYCVSRPMSSDEAKSLHLRNPYKEEAK